MSSKVYKVKKYDRMLDAHYLVLEEGDRWIYADLTISGGMKDRDHEELVGKKVEIGRMTPYLIIAKDIEVVE